MPSEAPLPRLIVAGICSGSGKTTITLGLVAALRRRGRIVQTFKVGPDFVDCSYLARASGRPCRNLDAWMLGSEGVQRSLTQGSLGSECAVIEGVGGLFDTQGLTPHYDAEMRSDTPHAFPGSTAEVAHLTETPVVIVLDVATMGETAAALALGLKVIGTDVSIIGVILNNTPQGNRRHAVEDAVWRLAKLPVLGALPEIPNANIANLRAGIVPISENENIDALLNELDSAVERYCDVALIERLIAQAGPLTTPHRPTHPTDQPPVRIAVAFDDAFRFYYAENLEMLEEYGAEIVPFSPLDDSALPHGIAAVYLGGGLLDRYAHRLADNHALRDSFRRAHAQGIPIYAESGGACYCAKTLRTSDGETHEMAGILPIDVAVDAESFRSGYRDLQLSTDCFLGERGTQLRGHEFHSTRVVTCPESLDHTYTMHDSDGEPLGCEGWQSGNLVASLVHLHFGHNPAIAERLVNTARATHDQRHHAGSTA